MTSRLWLRYQLPRWMSLHVEENTLLGELFDIIGDSLFDLSFWASARSRCSIHGHEGLPRLVLRVVDNIPLVKSVSFVSNFPRAVTGVVEEVDGISTLLWEPYRLVFFNNGGDIYLRNIGMVSFPGVASTGTGRIDLTPLFAEYEPLEDAQIVLKDNRGNITIVDPVNIQSADNTVTVPEGVYEVRYIAKTIVSSALSAGRLGLDFKQTHVMVNNNRVLLASVDMYNLWDGIGLLFGTKRKAGESNAHYKARIQGVALAGNNLEVSLVASLGLSRFAFWDTKYSLFTPPSTGYSLVDIWGTNEVEYLREAPVRLGNSSKYYLGRLIYNYAHVDYKGSHVDSRLYQASGNVIEIFDPTILQDKGNVGELKVSYPSRVYRVVRNEDNEIAALERGSILRDLLTVILGRGVSVSPSVRRFHTWRWGKTEDIRAGAAIFE